MTKNVEFERISEKHMHFRDENYFMFEPENSYFEFENRLHGQVRTYTFGFFSFLKSRRSKIKQAFIFKKRKKSLQML